MTTMTAVGAGLRMFADPASVAVVGASADPVKWGYWLARGALTGSGRRRVDLVNARGVEIEGVASVRSLAELDHAPELVVLSTPAALVPEVVDQALALGTRGFLGITAGLNAVRPGLEAELAARIRAAGARLIGPNCLGLYDSATDLELAWGTFTPGEIAIISQSGQLGLELAGLAAHAGLGVSRFVSIGNQVDVTAAELLADLAGHEATRAVILYLESFTDGRSLVDTLAMLAAAGKPVVVLTIGSSDAARAAAKSHTGAMTSGRDVVAAACRAAGAVLVDTPAQAIDVTHVLTAGVHPRGRRVAIVSDSGGQGGIAADTFARAGLTVPPLGEGTRERLAGVLPPAAATANPVDLAGAGEQDLASYARVVETLAASGEVDTVVLSGYFGCYGADSPALIDRELAVVARLGEVSAAVGVPVIVHSMSTDSVAVAQMRRAAVPTLPTIDAVALALAAAIDRAPAPPGPVADVVPGEPHTLDYVAGRELLRGAGVRYPAAVAVRDAADIERVAILKNTHSILTGKAADAVTSGNDEASGPDSQRVSVFQNLSGPYVLKAGWLAHKTELGGVVVNLPDADAAAAALDDMRARLGDGDYVLEELDRRTDTVELIVGARRDEAFGPVIMVGLGGIHAELYRDSALALAPVSQQQAETMIRSLTAAPLITGWRGSAPKDLAGAARVVAAVSQLIAADGTIAEAEINPLRVGPATDPDGAIAVDALVSRVTPPEQAPTTPTGARP